MEALKIKQPKYSYADYLLWNNDDRWELIDGVPYAMAAPNRRHQEIFGNLFFALHQYLKGKKCRVYAVPFDVRLCEKVVDDKKVFTVVQPDISVFCNSKKLDKRGASGPPDLAIEILSEATAVRDLNLKLLLYQKHRVKEYWIVDPVRETVNLYHLDRTNRYETTGEYTKNDIVKTSLFPGFQLKVKTIFSS